MPSINPADRSHSELSGRVSSSEKREEAWKFCAATIERHYDERLKRWNTELDMLLVFAGLFSAALTAFNVQSYLLLQPDNTDTIVLALVAISAQIGSYSVNNNFANSTQPVFTPPDVTPFSAPRYAVWMNALWFSSLACTLSASSIAVMVKQWLHQYAQGLSGNSADMARLRQYRYDSLIKWHVPEIIALLPILLQAALALFFAGLVILLYNLHSSVAITVTILVGALILFTVATTILPAYYADCCYQSPQALTLFVFMQATHRAIIKILEAIERKAESWDIDTITRMPSYSIISTYTRFAARSCLNKLETKGPFHSWQAREKPDVDTRREELEQSIALTTFNVVLDKTLLNTTVVPCLSEMESLSERMSIQYGELVLGITEKLKKAHWPAWRPALQFILVVLSLIVKEPRPGAMQKILSNIPEHRLMSANCHLGMLFLLSMANLTSNGIEPRKAFDNLLRYLRHAQVDQEKSPMLGRTVLPDVEAAFPIKWQQLEQLVNFDNSNSISHYLTGVESVVLYLLRHKAHLGEHLLPVEQRVVTMLRGVRGFLQCPAWQSSIPRQENVFWALRSSRLPEIVWTLRRARDTATLVRDEVILTTDMLKDVIDILGQGYMSSRSIAASQSTQHAFARLRIQLWQFNAEENLKDMKTSMASQAGHGVSTAETPPVDGQDEPLPQLSSLRPPPDTPQVTQAEGSANRTLVESESSDDIEVDVVAMSEIFDMVGILDDIPRTPASCRDSDIFEELAEGSAVDPVLPRHDEMLPTKLSRSRRNSFLPEMLAINAVIGENEVSADNAM
ncbi:hypothetical protein C8Q79DRAFT_1011531 [Trametes meyenii]|nr:hypothetical protein C8Q79DRAFT_1011531 [Trametes meyenii]